MDLSKATYVEVIKAWLRAHGWLAQRDGAFTHEHHDKGETLCDFEFAIEKQREWDVDKSPIKANCDDESFEAAERTNREG